MKEPVKIELPTLHPQMMVNAYLFLKPQPVLIDCGVDSPEGWQALVNGLKTQGLKVKDLEQVIITHAHIDHMGLAGKIARESKASVWVNEYCYPWALDVKKMWKQRAQLIEEVISMESPPEKRNNPGFKTLTQFFHKAINSWDNIPEASLEVFKVGDILEFGGGKWEVIYAPGHSNTQTCFYEAGQQWLLSADMLLSITPTPAIEFLNEESREREISLLTLMKSLKAMRQLEVSKAFPGHYDIINDHTALINRQLNRIQERKEECLQWIQEGFHRFYKIHQKMYNSPSNIFSISMLKGYLDLLEIEGHIVALEQEGYMAYLAK